jgi:hypothetical protein
MSGWRFAVPGPICADAEDAHAARIGSTPYSAIFCLTESFMRRSRFLQSLLAAAALAAPLLAVADPGQAAGSFRPDTDGDHAFLYEDGGMADQDMLTDPAVRRAVDGGAGIDGLQQVSTVPEPPTVALLAAGLALGLARGRGGVRRPVRRRRG